LSDGRKKEIYRDVRFFRGAIQMFYGARVTIRGCLRSSIPSLCIFRWYIFLKQILGQILMVLGVKMG